jgi:hypothetical protein
MTVRGASELYHWHYFHDSPPLAKSFLENLNQTSDAGELLLHLFALVQLIAECHSLHSILQAPTQTVYPSFRFKQVKPPKTFNTCFQ